MGVGLSLLEIQGSIMRQEGPGQDTLQHNQNVFGMTSTLFLHIPCINFDNALNKNCEYSLQNEPFTKK